MSKATADDPQKMAEAVERVSKMEAGHVHNLKNKYDFDAAMQICSEKKKVWVLDCFAVWCGPCKTIAPVLVNHAATYKDNAMFFKIDVDEVPDVAQELSVRAMPTFFVFDRQGEKLLPEIVGANAKALEEKIKAAIQNDAPA